MNKIAASLCVVDDDASIRESVEGLLWAEGLRVETYCSAREFLARTTVEPPGCLELQGAYPRGNKGTERIWSLKQSVSLMCFPAKELVEYWQSCPSTGTPVDTEARMRRRDGVYRWFLFSRKSPGRRIWQHSQMVRHAWTSRTEK